MMELRYRCQEREIRYISQDTEKNQTDQENYEEYFFWTGLFSLAA